MKLSLFSNKVDKGIPENVQEHLRTIHEIGDIIDNESTILPENEQIKLRCIWVIEIYPPSHIDNLMSCIEKLNWNITHNALPYSNVSKWIKDNRQSSFGSWINLGYLKSNKTSSIDRYAPIPDGFDGAFGTILQLIPSTTILMMQFLVNSETEQILEKPLNSKYSTFVNIDNGIYSFISPLHQKKLAIENLRNNLYNECYKWFKTHAPGVFSSGIYGGVFPTCEFTTLKEGKPFIDFTNNPHFEYIRMLDFSSTAYVWQSNDLPGILLGLPSRQENEYSRLYFSGNFDEIFSNNENILGGHEKNTMGFSIALSNLRKEIGLWSLFIQIKAFESQLSRVRDKTALISYTNLNTAILKIRQIEQQYHEIEKNVSIILLELGHYCNETNFRHDYMKFLPCNSWLSNVDFFENIRIKMISNIEYIKDLRYNVHQVINNISQNISSLSNDYVAKTNTRIQIWVISLTVATLLLAVVTGWDKIKELYIFLTTYFNGR